MLVPLRFVSEAMGARVDWDNAMRVVYITSGEVSQPVPPPVVAPPVAQPPAPTSTVVEVSGRIDAVTARAVVLEDGQAYALADDAQFYLNGRAVPRQRLREGMEVTLRFSDANQVVEVQAQGLVGQPPSGPAAVRISSLTHNATGGLSTGDTITVQLRGTPGGQAFFDIFGVAASVPMTEVATGLYQGSYVMRAGNTVSDAAIFGRLRVGGRDAPIARADAPVTIDTTGPVIVQRFPERDRQVNNARPNIVIVFSDAGSGIDPSRTRLIVEGQDVTTRVTVTDTAITYNPHEPLSGRVNVRVILRDRAGNVTDERYSFTIGDSSALGIRSVTLNPTAPLRAGDGEVLTVTMAGTRRVRDVLDRGCDPADRDGRTQGSTGNLCGFVHRRLVERGECPSDCAVDAGQYRPPFGSQQQACHRPVWTGAGAGDCLTGRWDAVGNPNGHSRHGHARISGRGPGGLCGECGPLQARRHLWPCDDDRGHVRAVVDHIQPGATLCQHGADHHRRGDRSAGSPLRPRRRQDG